MVCLWWWCVLMWWMGVLQLSGRLRRSEKTLAEYKERMATVSHHLTSDSRRMLPPSSFPTWLLSHRLPFPPLAPGAGGEEVQPVDGRGEARGICHA